jgi:hypothetical protein
MDFLLPESFIDEFIDVLDRSYRNYGIVAEVRSDQKRLIVEIADDPDSHISGHLVYVGFEFGAKLCIFDVMDKSDKTRIILDSQSPSFCSEM